MVKVWTTVSGSSDTQPLDHGIDNLPQMQLHVLAVDGPASISRQPASIARISRLFSRDEFEEVVRPRHASEYGKLASLPHPPLATLAPWHW